MADSPLCDLLLRQARDRGAAEAVRSEAEGASLAFAELARRVEDRARTLREAGLGPDGLVALAAGNTPAFIEIFFALRRLGAPVLSLDAGLGPDAAVDVCRRLGARHLLPRSGELLDLGHAPPPPPGTALVKMTSGSTVDPRGACFTEEALVEGIAHIREGMELTAGDRVLISIPLSHSYGFDNGILSLAAVGTPLILQPDVLPAALLRTIRDRAVTFFPAVPALIRALAQAAWPANLPLRSVICASAPLAPEIAEQFARASGLRVRQFLGATECGGIAFERNPADPDAAGTVGVPLPGVRIDFGPDGGVRVHSKANRFALLPAAPVEDFVETGDRAEWTPGGRLRLLGRIRPLANVGGFKIDLGTIDAFLRGQPGVEEALALAVEDPARGQRIVACVESRTQTPPALLEICRRRLSAREVPSEIRIFDRMPRTDRGKVDRAALAVLVREPR